MKPVTQTTFGDVYGNCFNAAVASILELDEIPDIPPHLPSEDEWRTRWSEFFAERGKTFRAFTHEPEENNWDCIPMGYSIGNANCTPESEHAVLHALVFHDGKLVHDPMPDQPFLKMDEAEWRKFPIVAWTVIEDKPMTDPNPKEQPVSDQQDTAKPTLNPLCQGNGKCVGVCGYCLDPRNDAPAPPSSTQPKVTKSYATEESRAHWKFVEETSKRVDSWPQWKKDAARGVGSSTQGARELAEQFIELTPTQTASNGKTAIGLIIAGDLTAAWSGDEIEHAKRVEESIREALTSLLDSFASSRNAELEAKLAFVLDSVRKSNAIARCEVCEGMEESLAGEEFAAFESRVAALTEVVGELANGEWVSRDHISLMFLCDLCGGSSVLKEAFVHDDSCLISKARALTQPGEAK